MYKFIKIIHLLYYRNIRMAGKDLVQGALAMVVIAAVYYYFVDRTLFGLLPFKQGFEEGDFEDGDGFEDGDFEDGEGFEEGYANMASSSSNGMAGPGQMRSPGAERDNVTGNPNASEGPANFGSTGSPAGCYPRDQLTPSELLPKSQNSVWSEQNPMGPGSLKGKNFLSAGALIGVNTVGQSLRNANWQLRSEPPNPQVAVSIFNQSTIAPDTNRRPLEIN